jgi:acetolactate synthase I/II/III large subunit
MNGGQLVVQCLKRHGAQFVFGLADTSIIDILDALHGERSIRYIGVRHEQIASMMADAYARSTGRPGVCLTQCGPGAMNLLYGVASAFKDSVPLVAITGNIDSSLVGHDAWHDIDLMALYSPVTRWSTRVTDASEIAPTLDRAFHVALSGRPGPVHVNIPMDLQAASVGAQERGVGSDFSESKATMLSIADVDRAVRALAEAEHPIIFAGGGVVWANATDALIRFSERSNIPVIVTDTARGAIPESHPNALGPSGFFGSKAASDALKDADVILGVGTRFPDICTGTWKFISPSATVIHNNIDPGEIGRHVPVTIGIAGDAGEFLKSMLVRWEAMNSQVRADSVSRIAALKRAVEAERLSTLTPPAGAHERIPIQAVVREIANVLDKRTVVTIDGGLHTFFSSRLRIEQPGSFLTSAGLGAMGYALPAAMGAKLARPERSVVALVGDGGFAMVSQDLETAVRCSIPIVVVVYNNGALGAQRLRQQRDYNGRFMGTIHGNPDFGELAKLYGAEGRTVRTIDEFRPAFEASLRSGRVSVVDVHIQ